MNLCNLSIEVLNRYANVLQSEVDEIRREIENISAAQILDGISDRAYYLRRIDDLTQELALFEEEILQVQRELGKHFGKIGE